MFFAFGVYLLISAAHACDLSVTVSTFTDPLVDGLPHGFVVDGNYAYLPQLETGRDRVTVLDLSDPSNLTIAGSVQDAQFLPAASAVAVSGNYAYVPSFVGSAVAVVDISNPESPAVVGAAQNASMDRIYGLAVQGDFVYVICLDCNTFFVLDVTVKSSPTLIGSLLDATNFDVMYAVALSGGHAFVLSGGSTAAIHTIDISDAANPTLVATFQNASLAAPVALTISGTYAYVADFAAGLFVVDITSPTSVIIVGSVTSTSMQGNGYVAFDASHNWVYVVATDANAIVVIDVSAPTDPVVLQSATSADLQQPRTLQIFGDHVLVSTGLTNPGSFTVLGRCTSTSSTSTITISSTTSTSMTATSSTTRTTSRTSTETSTNTITTSVSSTSVSTTISASSETTSVTSSTSSLSTSSTATDLSLASTEDDGSSQLGVGYTILFVAAGALTICLIVACAFVLRQQRRDSPEADAEVAAQA